MTVVRKTTAQLTTRAAELEAELDKRKSSSERQAAGILASPRDKAGDEYDPNVDTSAQQAAALLKGSDD